MKCYDSTVATCPAAVEHTHALNISILKCVPILSNGSEQIITIIVTISQKFN